MTAVHPGWSAVDPPHSPVLLVNPASGGGRAARAGIAEHARERGIRTLCLSPGGSLDALVREALDGGTDALGMAGGDGSLAVVAAAARMHGLPFVCVPAGTRNHFARDLGVDLRHPAAALSAFTTGMERRVDLAEVNGRIFLNNVSLGVYGEAVRRPSYREAKARILVETVAAVLAPGAAPSSLRLVDDLGREHADPLVVLVSNNAYALEPAAAPGTRPALDGGQLGIVVLDRPPGPRRAPGRAWSAAALEVTAPAPLHAGIDGEAVDLDPPLHFALLPAALRVRIAADTAGHR